MAQGNGNVTGNILDAETREPLVAVNISVDRRSGTISDSEGKFSLFLTSGIHILEFYYVGYEVSRKEIIVRENEAINLTILMQISSRMLEEVVVSEGKYEQKLSELTVSMEVLKPHQISDQNITSLDMLLEKTPGISILDGQPSIRGGSGFSYGVGSRVLMLVDDLPMLTGDAADIKWNYLPVENMNQVEVIKGASSVLYGSSALNGVINLRTRFPGNIPENEVTVFRGAYMEPERDELVWWDKIPVFTGASFSHLRKIGNLDLSIAGNYFKDEGYRELEFEHRLRGNLGLRYHFKKLRGLSIGVTASAMYLEASDLILWLNADSGAYRQSPDSYTPLAGYRYNIDPFIEYFSPKGDRHSLKTRLFSVGNDNMDIDKQGYSKLHYAEYRYLNKIKERTNWTSGITYLSNTVWGNMFLEHQGVTTAVYSQLDTHVKERLKLSAGVRWEINKLNDELDYSVPVFRAGINYQAAQNTFLRASIGQGYRFPSVAEKFASAEVGALKIFKNPELEPERGWNAEAGIKQAFSFGRWIGFLDLAAFRTEYKNMIEYTFGAYPQDTSMVPTIDDIGFKALNIGTARITGLELSVSGEGRAGPLSVQMMAGYTYMNPVDPSILDEVGKDEDESYILKYRRRHLLKGDLNLRFRGLFTGLNFQYNSRMVNVDDVFIDPLFGNLILPGFPEYWTTHSVGYSLLDVRLGWDITEWIRINTVIRNVLNVEYLGRPGDLGPPRNITLQTRFKF
ncbi:MAG: TonB-dependent receptor [Draconibacterium sp.]|nr:TonB-dependent receptor [Draconibacterium sp.]